MDRDVDGDLLALADDNQVDVLDDGLDRVALHVLGQGQLLVSVDDEGEQGVGVLEGHHRVVAGHGDVDRVGAVAVDDGGHLAGAADAARRALAELGAELDVKTVLGGQLLLLKAGGGLGGGRHGDRYAVAPGRWSLRGRDIIGHHRVDHGRRIAAPRRGIVPRVVASSHRDEIREKRTRRGRDGRDGDAARPRRAGRGREDEAARRGEKETVRRVLTARRRGS
ncbi:hypothetical protein BN11_1470002 [Nostocoides australiense Ben110]|uniref:Uncharacterized protein n=1 Tax=Nostocoides australiense Ben110 TaxID=1193182 RepID=W6JSV6_9MICO|nr:hypothetical protein BN11_1470002 [Tetrasphaera australiensis Ben110]